jgi:alpha/beta hydrolase fold
VEYPAFYPMTQILAVSVLLASLQSLAQAQGKEHPVEHATFYRTVQIDGLSIFCREAGPKDAPVLLLLHGLPSSSRMFEPLFARLSDRYHLIASDYPGFGHSDWPDPKKFAYTFGHIAEIMNHSPKRSGSRATPFTCRITAARWVFAWCWRIRNEWMLSSFRTL